MSSCHEHDHHGCSAETATTAAAPAPPLAQAGQHVLVLRIDQMCCPTEESLIRSRLQGMAGVHGLDFNLMQRRLTLRHDLADPAAILDALTELRLVPVVVRDEQAGSTAVFRIDNMDCPTEEKLIRSKLGGMAGVLALEFNLMQRQLSVRHSLTDTAGLSASLAAIGMQALPVHPTATGATPTALAPAPSVSRRDWLLLGCAGIAAALAEVVAFTTGNDASLPVVALAVLAIALGGLETYKKGWIALRHRNLNINALMSIAVTGAVLIGQWPEAAMVMVLFTLAEAIEVLSLDRARHAIRDLMGMAPEQATVQQVDGSWDSVDSKQVMPGATVRIAPGERIPLDGILLTGQSVVNQAPITGESMPVTKAAGDTVFAGTLNETGSFDYRVTASADDSTLARIIHAVEEAQGRQAPTQRFIDRFSRIYTPVVCVLAALVAVGPPLLLGAPWMDWLYKALVLLVIACPCALVISTPVTVVSGLAAAARRGILIKGGAYLEAGRKLSVLALDKTGTLTEGKPQVTNIIALAPEREQNLRLAASLAARSDHPVSTAIARHWESLPNALELLEITEFSALLGRGVKGRSANGWLYLGNQRLMRELGVLTPAADSALQELEAAGKTVIVVSDEHHSLLVIGVADTVRATSRQALAELHQLGVRTLMLSGDNEQTVRTIARDVGIDDARGGLLPADKRAIIEAELAAHSVVGMVGDGINDAPALAQASIGFAMGAAGTDTAIDTADVALMDDDLRKIPAFIRLSRRTMTILTQNIVLALGIKAVFLVLALLGMATLWMAVFADMGASLLVVANGLRMLRSEPAQTSATKEIL